MYFPLPKNNHLTEEVSLHPNEANTYWAFWSLRNIDIPHQNYKVQMTLATSEECSKSSEVENISLVLKSETTKSESSFWDVLMGI